MKPNIILQLRQNSRKLIRELGILELDKAQKHTTPQHWYTLIEINNEPNITISKLSDLLLISYSSIFRIVNSLIKANLVTSKSGIDKRENYLNITEKGLNEITKIDEFSNKKIIGALKFLSEQEQINIIDSIKKYGEALEKSRTSFEQVKIYTLSTSRTIRKQIVGLIDNIQKNELHLPITEEFNASILNAETEFYYDRSYHFWYAVDESGVIIGSIGLKKIDKVNAEIKKFFVHKNYRGKDVANKLMLTLMKSALKYHFKFLYIGTIETVNAAHRFYEKNGFSRISEQNLPEKFEKSPLDSIFFKKSVCKE